MDEGSHRVGELVQGTDAGEVPAIDGVGGGQVVVIPGENAHDVDALVGQGPDLHGGVLDAVVRGVFHKASAVVHLDHVVGFHVGEEDYQLVFAGGVFQSLGQGPDGQAVPVAAGGEIAEDPLVAGEMAAAMVEGIQSEGVGASLKHFACNNKETNRKDCDSRLSERALREIYLKGFELCVKKAQPLTVMSSYNLVNGLWASQNRELLTDILRGEWGFKGMVTTDWYTHAPQYTEIAAGNDVKMGCGDPAHVLQMMREGRLKREDVVVSVRRLLEMILKLA